MFLINLLEQVVGKPQTVQGVTDRMVLRVTDPEDKEGFKGKYLCHSVTADYAKTGKDSEVIVFLGVSDNVYHSIVTNFHGDIMADSMSHKKPTFNGTVYRIEGNELFTVKTMFVRDFKKLINK
jgi:hypothetical protein